MVSSKTRLASKTLPTFLPSYLPIYQLPSYLPTYLPSFLPTYLPTFLATYLAYLPTYLEISKDENAEKKKQGRSVHLVVMVSCVSEDFLWQARMTSAMLLIVKGWYGDVEP